MKPRRFECTSGSSNKFWEVRNLGRKHEVTYGRIGTSGSPFEKDHGSRVRCAAAIKKLIRSKLAKGYVEVALNGAIGGMTEKEILDQIENATNPQSWLDTERAAGRATVIEGEAYKLGKPIPTMGQAQAKADAQRKAWREQRIVNDKLKKIAANAGNATTAELEAIRKLAQQVERKLEDEAMKAIVGMDVAAQGAVAAFSTFSTVVKESVTVTREREARERDKKELERKVKRLTFRRRGPKIG